MADLPQERTELTPEEAASAILTAFRTVFGEDPSGMTLTILVAQSALETGQWQSMWRWNFGNIRAGRSWHGDTQSLRGADEIVDGERITGAAVEAGFRAYATCHDGAVDFLRFLGVDTTPYNGKPNRYQAAWDAAMAGDVNGYVRELKRAGYYTASEAKYRAAMVPLVRQLEHICRSVLRADTEPAPPPDTEAALAALDEAEVAIGHARAALRRV